MTTFARLFRSVTLIVIVIAVAQGVLLRESNAIDATPDALARLSALRVVDAIAMGAAGVVALGCTLRPRILPLLGTLAFLRDEPSAWLQAVTSALALVAAIVHLIDALPEQDRPA